MVAAGISWAKAHTRASTGIAVVAIWTVLIAHLI